MKWKQHKQKITYRFHDFIINNQVSHNQIHIKKMKLRNQQNNKNLKFT